MDPVLLGCSALTAAYRSRRTDPVAVLEAYLARIAREDAALRTYITVAAETARAEAIRSAARWAELRPVGPLDGVPIALKDNIDVAGLPCTAGTEAFRTRIPLADARVAARLRAQGAVLLGKLNMHEAALGATTDNPIYGRCMNPRQTGYTPGGSSGGSGGAVAAHLCCAALGTDTMGSVRIPASYCGVFGFKPSNGAIRTDGVIPLSPTLDCVGVLASTAADCAVLARVLLEAPPLAWRVLRESGPVSLAGLRVGVPRQIEKIEFVPAVRAAFQRFLDRLRAAGVAVVDVDLPGWEPRKARLAGLLVSEAEGAVYYERELGAGLPGLSPASATMLRFPAQAGIARIVLAYETIERLRNACLLVFADVDLLALPTAPQMSFPHESKIPDNQADCTSLANFGRAPAVSLPFAADPLPIGMQLMAAPGDDLRLLEIAQHLDFEDTSASCA